MDNFLSSKLRKHHLYFSFHANADCLYQQWTGLHFGICFLAYLFKTNHEWKFLYFIIILFLILNRVQFKFLKNIFIAHVILKNKLMVKCLLIILFMLLPVPYHFHSPLQQPNWLSWATLIFIQMMRMVGERNFAAHHIWRLGCPFLLMELHTNTRWILWLNRPGNRFQNRLAFKYYRVILLIKYRFGLRLG